MQPRPLLALFILLDSTRAMPLLDRIRGLFCDATSAGRFRKNRYTLLDEDGGPSSKQPANTTDDIDDAPTVLRCTFRHRAYTSAEKVQPTKRFGRVEVRCRTAGLDERPVSKNPRGAEENNDQQAAAISRAPSRRESLRAAEEPAIKSSKEQTAVIENIADPFEGSNRLTCDCSKYRCLSSTEAVKVEKIADDHYFE
ncbi:hypothetical protein PAPHI01_0134 [Pancytospora philotis]|nr:hypothetical protein PAPHI01_0134 [Pancytospora philotis]